MITATQAEQLVKDYGLAELKLIREAIQKRVNVHMKELQHKISVTPDVKDHMRRRDYQKPFNRSR